MIRSNPLSTEAGRVGIVDTTALIAAHQTAGRSIAQAIGTVRATAAAAIVAWRARGLAKASVPSSCARAADVFPTYARVRTILPLIGRSARVHRHPSAIADQVADRPSQLLRETAVGGESNR